MRFFEYSLFISFFNVAKLIIFRNVSPHIPSGLEIENGEIDPERNFARFWTWYLSGDEFRLIIFNFAITFEDGVWTKTFF